MTDMIEEFLAKFRDFAENHPGIEGVVVVGSYARGTHRETSDLDLCIITAQKDEFVKHPDFVKSFGPFQSMQTEFYGACTSIRVWYETGLEVEFGLVKPSWIGLPLDGGTLGVLRSGYLILLDKSGRLQSLEL